MQVKQLKFSSFKLKYLTFEANYGYEVTKIEKCQYLTPHGSYATKTGIWGVNILLVI